MTLTCEMKAAAEQRPLEAVPCHFWDSPAGDIAALFFRTPHGYLARFPALADFEWGREGERVLCRPAPAASAEVVQHLLDNQVAPLVLGLRGRLVFHASAVEVHDQAIAFMGRSGLGKSTLAAAFARAGHAFLTDDALLVERTPDGFSVLPAAASIRLRADSVQSIGLPASEPAAESLKHRLHAGASLPHRGAPLPLRRIYVLDETIGEAVQVTPATPAEGVMALVRHSFQVDPVAPGQLESSFDALSALVNAVAIFHLHYPRRFEALPQVIARIEEECRVPAAGR